MNPFKDFVRRLIITALLCSIILIAPQIIDSLQHKPTHLFFLADRERFIEVDRGVACGHRSVVAADRETGVLYIFTDDGGISPLFQNDGELMIYDAN